jgi:tetratricopeptide (TPR) repeat protein
MFPSCARYSMCLDGVERSQGAKVKGGLSLLLLFALGACQSVPETRVSTPAVESVPEDPAGVSMQFERALTLLGAGDVDLAVKELELLSGSNPEYSGPVLNLGIAYSKSGKFPEAEQAFKMAIARKPDSAAAYNQLGILYRKLGRFTDAVNAYQRALEIQPDYALVHLNLGVLYDLYLQQPDKALQEFVSYESLTGGSDAVVSGWIKEIKSRLGGAARAGRSEA